MLNQMSMTGSPEVPSHDLAQYRKLFQPNSLRALSAREALLHAARFERREAEFLSHYQTEFTPIGIGLLASLSSQILVSILRLSLFGEGISPRFKIGEFDSVAGNAFDPEAGFWSTSSDVLLVLPATDDIKSWPSLFANENEIEAWVEEQARPLLSVWSIAGSKNPECQIYQATYVEPLFRQLGNLEFLHPFSRTRCIRRLNAHLTARRPRNVTIVDFEFLAALSGKEHWFDETAYFTTKQPFSIRLMPVVCAYLSRLIAASRGAVRKCIVLDLDNTLWGGVVGDDGVAGLRLSPTDPLGEAYLAFQSYLLALKERGVLLAVCSKNDEAVARSAFRDHPDMILQEEDFAAFVANWDDKATNIRRIAIDLNIGIDSLVFFDDNPAERSLVRQFEPSVMVIEVPEDPSRFIRALELSFAFEWPQLTVEDRDRVNSYHGNKARSDALAHFSDYDSYLKSLEMTAVVRYLTEDELPRFHQLINKTNQFNLRTVRYTEQVLSQLCKEPSYRLVEIRLSDKFTNYGSVANTVLRLVDDNLFIENWVMSCRAFKRGLEDATFEAILEIGRLLHAHYIVGEYVETPKNSYVKSLLSGLGLSPWTDSSGFPCQNPAGQLLRAPLAELSSKIHHISVETTLR
jgi:FkbH-like protein